MSGCHNPQKNRNPNCEACNGLIWREVGVIPPQCICDDSINLSTLDKIIKKHWDFNYQAQENLSKRLSQLEHFGSSPIVASLHNLDERLKKIEERFSIHEINLKRKWDANSELSQRLTETEEKILKMNAEVTAINKQKFSEFHHLRPDMDKLAHGMYQIRDELSQEIGLLEARFKQIENIQHSMSVVPYKTPHKCPVCDGEGTRHGLYNNSSAPCEPCEGKGIVWG